MNYCIIQNFGSRKHGKFGGLHAANSLKFYPPTIFILAHLLYKAANPPVFLLGQQSVEVFCRQSFVLYSKMHTSLVHIPFVTIVAVCDWICENPPCMYTHNYLYFSEYHFKIFS